MEASGVIEAKLTKDGKDLGTFYVAPKEFSTGSIGWYESVKMTLPDGTKLQGNLQFVVIRSKPVASQSEAQSEANKAAYNRGRIEEASARVVNSVKTIKR